MSRSDRDETVRLDVLVRPAQPTTITQWALRYDDGQTLISSSEAKARRDAALAHDRDPCVVVSRTVTVTTTGWQTEAEAAVEPLTWDRATEAWSSE